MSDVLDGSLASLKNWLTAKLAESLDRPAHAIDVHEQFSRYGIESVAAMGLLAALSEALQRPLPATLLWEHPTIDALARHLAQAPAGTPSGTLASTLASSRAQAAAHVTHERFHEPIAIIGMACRFPKAPSKEAFWDLLCAGIDAISEVPAERWNAELLHDPDPTAPGKTVSRWGGYLDEVDRFDPQAFGISPREATDMDPQQRLALEVAWEALEDAGVPVHGLSGSATGVFFGVMWRDYSRLPGSRIEAIAQHTATGQDTSIIAARISYTLGLQGPSLAVNTACSSSLVALHLACQSLRSGESRLAIAGGVNLLLAPESTVAMSKFGGLSPDGRCFTFDARANGYVRGEGAGAVVLKPLSRALADGDPVYCVIRGSAANNDGASNGLTAPNPQAQEAVLRTAYAQAGVEPASVHYVEAHGTGTFLGDPIEVKALGAVLGQDRPRARPLRIASAKSNIGHLEAAAGIAGVIKTALCIQHRRIPASLHLETPNPHIPFDALNIQVQQVLGPWPEDGTPATAGVSSFGFGGTNCHVVLQELPAPVQAEILALAGDSQAGVRTAAQQALQWLTSDAGQLDHLPLATLCSTAAQGRAEGAHRLAVVARSREQLAEQLATFLRGDSSPGVFTGTVRPGADRGPVLVFSGQGSQWPGMARTLLRAEPVFRERIHVCEEIIARLAGWSLTDELLAESGRSRLHEPEIGWPAVVAVEVALAALWQAWGIEPAAVVGHSIGEIAAAHVAGALELEDCLRVVCAQGRLIQRTHGRGAMALVGMSWDEAGGLLGRWQGRVHRAIRASADSTVLTGEARAIDEVVAAAAQCKRFARRVQGEVAAHSPELAVFQDELRAALASIRAQRPRLPMVSIVTGERLGEQPLDADYWVRNFVSPVLFADAIAVLARDGHEVFLEVGPHPIVDRAMTATLARNSSAAAVLASLRRGQDELVALRDTLARLYTLGLPVQPGARGDASAVAEAPCVLPLSARSPQALQALARSWQALVPRWSAAHAHWRVRDVAHAAAVHRSHHEHRVAVVARSWTELDGALAAFVAGERTASAVAGQRAAGGAPRIAFVFAGQGAQWVGMGRALLCDEPVFRRMIDRCDALLQPLAGWTVSQALAADEASSRLHETEVVQPVMFALQVALAALWRSWGIVPDAVIGHSVGELAAAHVAGSLSLDDALRVVYHRGRLMQGATSQDGRMLSVERAAAELAPLLEAHAGRVAVAASNGPTSVVLAGDRVAIEAIAQELERSGVYHRRVPTNYAFHSHHMEPFQAPLAQAIAGLAPAPATCTLYSTVTGAAVAGTALDASYWARNLREPVRFAEAIQAAMADGYRVFVEIGPHPVLAHNIRQCLAEAGHEGVSIASMRREHDSREVLAQAVAALYAQGCTLAWERIQPAGQRDVPLPRYPFQRERYWLEPGKALPRSAAHESTGQHPLLGARFSVPVATGSMFWEQVLSTAAVPYLADHVVEDAVVLPGAAYVEMALAAAGAVSGGRPCALGEVAFERMLTLAADEARTVQTVLTEDEGGQRFEIFSQRPGSEALARPIWIRHASGTVRVLDAAASPASAALLAQTPAASPAEILARCSTARDSAEHYAQMTARGLHYGRRFQGVTRLWLGQDEVLGALHVPAEIAGQLRVHGLHPAVLDAAIQVAMALFFTRAQAGTLVPVGMGEVRVHRPLGPELAAGELWAHARLAAAPAAGTLAAELRLLSADGHVIAEVGGLSVRALEPRATARPAGEDWLYTLTWEPSSASAPSSPAGASAAAGTWLVLADETAGVGAGLAARWQQAGQAVVRVVRGARYERLAPGRYSVDPARGDDLRAVLRDAFGEHVPCCGAVYLWGLDTTPVADTTVDTLAADQAPGCVGALQLAQALVQHGWRDTPRLWLVTRGAQAVAGAAQPLAVAQAPLWGLGRTLAIEHPELSCTCVDLGPDASLERAVQALADELALGDREGQVAWRPEGRYVARLSRSTFALAEAADEPLSAEATYLITGGLGGLGLVVARWLVERGARHLVLASRQGARGPETEAALAALAEAGAEVVVARADVARRADVAQLLADIDARMPPLRGVMHAAGVLADATAMQLEAGHVRTVMAPKMLGAWNLHELTAGRRLDHFVLFSSAAALLGFAGQGNYAAANAFLDGLAQHRRHLGLPGLSIAWGTFAEVGMAAARANRGERLASRGVGSIPPAQGMAVLGLLLHEARAHIGVIPLDVRQWLEFYPTAAGAPLWRALLAAQTQAAQAAQAAQTAGTRLPELLARTAPEQRRAVLESQLQDVIAQVLGMSAARLDRTRSFGDMGLDSLMSLELRNRIEASVGSRLPATLLFTYPSLAALGEHLLGQIPLPVDAAPTVASASEAAEPDAHARLVQEVAELSEDEAERLLRESLENLLGDM